MGGSCVNLSAYSGCRDKYGVRVGAWAVQKAPGVAGCQICPGAMLTFNRGKSNLIQHSETKKHRNAQPSTEKNNQPDIRDALREEEGEVKSKARDFEIALVQALGRHDVPCRVVECVAGVVKDYVTDSEIVKEVKLGRTKVLYTTEHGLGAMYEEETVKKLKECDAFGVAFDESEVNKKSELVITVKISSKEEDVETRHYKSIDLEAGDAETITNAVLDTFIEDKVDFKKKMISVDMDGCSTMQGCKSGVMTRLMKEVPQLSSMGSSNSHNLSNAMMHGVTKADPDMKEALVDLYYDIGGAKGKGLKKQKECLKVAEEMGHNFSPIKRFVSTRFRTLRYCIEPVLHNFSVLVRYYRGLKKPSPRQMRLQVLPCLPCLCQLV